MKLSKRQMDMIGSFVTQKAQERLCERRDAFYLQTLNEETEGVSIDSVYDDPELEDATNDVIDTCAEAVVLSVIDAVHKATGEDKEVLKSLLEDSRVEIFFDVKSRFQDEWLPSLLGKLA